MPKIHGVNHQDAVRALQKAGVRVIRQGKHIVMTDGVRILTVPRYNPVNAYTIDRPILNPLEISRRKFPTGQLSLRLEQLRWPKLAADDIGVGCDHPAPLAHRSGGYPISTTVPLLTRRWLVARSTITRATASGCRSERGSASGKMSGCMFVLTPPAHNEVLGYLNPSLHNCLGCRYARFKSGNKGAAPHLGQHARCSADTDCTDPLEDLRIGAHAARIGRYEKMRCRAVITSTRSEL